MHDEPLVSVLKRHPVYNGEDYLAECIESVLKQTYKNYEYIIANNCSTDRTLDIPLDYAQKRQQDSSSTLMINSLELWRITILRCAGFLQGPSTARWCVPTISFSLIVLREWSSSAEANPIRGHRWILSA